MSVSAIVSEASVLRAIWMGTAALCAASFFVMVVLIVRRAWLDTRSQRRQALRQSLSRFILAALKSPVPLEASAMPRVMPADQPVLVRLALDMLRNLRGRDAMRIVDLLRLWRLDDFLYTAARKGSKGGRIRAVTLLGHFYDKASLDLLLDMVDDADLDVQLAALRALAARGATGHMEAVVEALSHSTQSNTLLLHDILQRFGRGAVPGLRQLARSDARDEIRVAAIMALGSIADLDAAPDLAVLSRDPAATVRAQAVAALGRLGDPASAAPVLACLDDAEAPVRVQAVQALGRLRPLKALPALAARLDDADWWVRFRAAEALYRFGDRGIAALSAYGRRPGQAGEMARQALLEFGGVR